MNQVFPLERAPEAYERMISGKARFRANSITFLSYIVAMITEQYGNNIAFE